MSHRPPVFTALRRHTAAKLLALVAAPVILAGCYRYQEWNVPAPKMTDPLILNYRDHAVTLTRPAMEGDSVVTGWMHGLSSAAEVGVLTTENAAHAAGDSVFVRLPLSGKEKQLRGAQTAMLAAAGFLVVVLLKVNRSDPCVVCGGALR